MISDIYVRIFCMCHTFIELIICGNNSQHSMLAFHKENTVSQKKCQGIFPIFMLAYLVNLYNLEEWGINGWYMRHLMSDFTNDLFNKNKIKIADIYVSVTITNINIWFVI